MENSYLKKYRIKYVVENTTGNMYSVDVNIDKLNWKVSLKTKIYRTNSFDPTEKLDWKRVAKVLMGDPIIRGICDSFYLDAGNPKRIDVISCKCKKFRTKHWYINIDNTTTTGVISIFNKISIVTRNDLNPKLLPDEFTTQSIDSFGLEVNIKMKSSLTDFIYLLKKTKYNTNALKEDF